MQQVPSKLVTAYLIVLTLAATCGLRADTIVDGSGEHELKVLEISGQNIKTDGSSYSAGSVKQVEFSACKLPVKDYGVILKDGTKLSGIMRKRGKDSYTFRSTTFGTLEIPKDAVAGFFYMSPYKTKFPIPGKICLVTRTGEVIDGKKLLWADEKSAAILAKERGLKKLEADTLVYALAGKFPQASKVVLRNGDVLNMPVNYAGKLVKLKLTGRDFTLPLKAVKTINFK